MRGHERDRSDEGPHPDSELIRIEALDVLHDVLEWKTTPEAWRHIARVLQVMADAISAGDPDVLAAGTADLELASPLRVMRIGETMVKSAPRSLRERVNHLIHSLELPNRTEHPGPSVEDGPAEDPKDRNRPFPA
jgi:CATRA-Associated Small Protein